MSFLVFLLCKFYQMSQSEIFFKWLQENLSDSLTGLDSQRELAPKFKGKDFRSFTPSSNYRNSAVMLICTESKGKTNIVFTLRSSKLNSHQSQISFPGGMNEEGESLLETAIRETQEEIGIKVSKESIAGALTSLYVPPSNTIIQPFIAFFDDLKGLTPNPDEVEEILFKDIDYFLDKNNLKSSYWDFSGLKILVPHWNIHDKTPLWGATSMILNEFLHIYKKYLKLE